jgi:hypothetical protein
VVAPQKLPLYSGWSLLLLLPLFLSLRSKSEVALLLLLL